MDKVITVEGLGKRYTLRHQQQGGYSYVALRDVLAGGVRQAVRKLAHPSGAARTEGPSKEDFWALKDVSFEVGRGERIGIIGRNGAGKSTLLKILSRITEPTAGRARIRGRVASLLEVGTGFHPELTGRENIYLNGAILGMSRADIKARFDEIVAFAEVEKFLDTPVKRYSSGMYVRLAFAVAAHLEPDILIVDEVLAVGDAAFQKKCMGKMEDVSKGGRTVLFVSHNMAAVQNLCRRGVVLQHGEVQFAGDITETIKNYLKNLSSTGSLMGREDRRGTGEIKVTAIELRDSRGNALDTVMSGQEVHFYLHYEAEKNLDRSKVIASIAVGTQLDVPVFLQHNRLTGDRFDHIPKKGAFVCRIKRLPLPPSVYNVTYSLIEDGDYLDGISNAVELTVTSGDFYGSGEVPPVSHGVCLVDASWRLEANTSVPAA